MSRGPRIERLGIARTRKKGKKDDLQRSKERKKSLHWGKN